MRIALTAGLACLTAISGLVAAPSTLAASATGVSLGEGAACQLSIPTTNTGVRPKATGFRNESTSVSNFVICPVSTQVAISNDQHSSVYIRVYSMDGATHSVSCTGVSGWDNNTVLYSTKTFDVSSSDPSYGYTVQWLAEDFGGTAGNPIPGSIGFSVTCNLPPQAAITQVIGVFSYEVGT